MKNLFAIAFLMLIGLYGCNVEQEESGELPEVDIDTEAGEMPEYDVNWADVDVTTRTKTVTVPKLVVVQEEKEVEVPVLDVDAPGENVKDNPKRERSIGVEAEVADMMHELRIRKVYADDDDLYVVAYLEQMDQPLQQQRVRVSDQIMLNVQEGVDIDRYIIGDRPSGAFNDQYEYFASEEELMDELDDAQEIYSR